MLGYELLLEDSLMGYKTLKGIWMGKEFFQRKIIFPSTPVPGINNDQSASGVWKTYVILEPIHQ